MNKYSSKILKMLDSIDYRFKFPTVNLNDNKFISDILNIVDNVQTENINLDSVVGKDIPLLHRVDQYPLLYIFFRSMYEKNLLNKLFDHSPDITNFWDFINWYTDHQHLIDYSSIEKIVTTFGDDEIHTLNKMIFKVSGDRKSLHSLLYDNPFVSIDVQQHAESIDLKYYILDNDEYKIEFYIPKDLEDHYSHLRKIVLTTKIMSSIAKKYNLYSKPKMVIFLGKQKKYKPKRFSTFTSKNVNSGSTMRRTFVNVWRYEEYCKVLIHELIHFFSMDFNYTDHYYNDVKSVIDKHFDVNGIDRCNEAYTETLATIIHSCVCSRFQNIDINKVYYYELKFITFQTAKIIKHFGGTRYIDLDKTKKSSSVTIKQYTSVLSYYILKMLLLYNIVKFINMVSEIKIRCTGDNVKTFSTLLHEIINSDFPDSDLVNIFIDKLDSSNDSFVYKTMRMTCMNM
jgi:hypothetical protein